LPCLEFSSPCNFVDLLNFYGNDLNFSLSLSIWTIAVVGQRFRRFAITNVIYEPVAVRQSEVGISREPGL
jgi:hypothetical protein